MRRRMEALPLSWRVFLAYTAVLLVAFAFLVVGPVTVSAPVALAEVAVLAAGLLVMLGVTALVTRRAFQPLREVIETMRRIDPLSPGERVPVIGGPYIAALARAFNDMLERLEHERRESARQALTVQEAERQRIARELHDEVGQIFTAMLLQVQSLTAHAPSELHDELAELTETARTGATDVRRIASRLRPEALEDLGLQSALSALATSFSEQTGISTERQFEHIAELNAEQELVVYRVAQEALTNVARHARAGSVEVSLRRDDGEAVLRVRDDGRGLPDEAMASSNGIRGMRERAMLIGGKLSLAARSPGTEVVLRVPAPRR